MRRVAIALLLTLGAPGLMLPAGIELRMCFCGGAGGGCCAARAEKAGCKRCCHAAPSGGPAEPIAKTARGCSGCVRVSVPPGDPAPAASGQPVDAIAPPPAEVAALPLPPLEPAAHIAPPLWHPPPGGRSLPLLI
jgi:hypothetical protein